MAKRPNIVFILVDDMGYGDFGCFSEGRTQTPTLDWLVQESLCLTQHYTGSPVCNPSRASLLTGRYPHRTGSIDTIEWRGLERLALRETTMADMLQRAGYTTGLVGKWHLGAFDPRYHPRRRGFDETVCFRGGMHHYYNWRIEYGEDCVRRGDDETYLTDVWTDEAVGFIERHAADEKPFFLHVTYNAPHGPLECPNEDVQPFREDGRFTEGVSIVYGMIKRMDAGVGRIVETLKKQGVLDDTIIVFTSDNGPQFGGQGDMCIDRFNCGFHGSKGYTYEGGVRLPAIIRWPEGGMRPGTTCDLMVHMTDWLPTILAMVGLHPSGPLPLDGVNVLAALRGENDKVQTRRFWQWNRYTPLVTCNAAMRDGDWKLVRPAIKEALELPDLFWIYASMHRHEYFLQHGVLKDPEPVRWVPPPPPPELYNIAHDPLEQNNLAEQEAARTFKMLGELETWFQEVEAERRAIDDVW